MWLIEHIILCQAISFSLAAASEDSDEDSSSDEDEEEEEAVVGLLGKRKKPADTAKATPAKKARNGDTASTPQQNGESKFSTLLLMSPTDSIDVYMYV